MLFSVCVCLLSEGIGSVQQPSDALESDNFGPADQHTWNAGCMNFRITVVSRVWNEYVSGWDEQCKQSFNNQLGAFVGESGPECNSFGTTTHRAWNSDWDKYYKQSSAVQMDAFVGESEAESDKISSVAKNSLDSGCRSCLQTASVVQAGAFVGEPGTIKLEPDGVTSGTCRSLSADECTASSKVELTRASTPILSGRPSAVTNMSSIFDSAASEFASLGQNKKSAIAKFTAWAIKNPISFDTKQTTLESDAQQCIDWRKSVSNTKATQFRETTISRIEHDANAFWQSGKVSAWLNKSDHIIKHISRQVNGPLLEQLVQEISYVDSECVELFREGAPLVGELPSQGGEKNKLHASRTVEKLKANCKKANMETLKCLREDKHSHRLLEEIQIESDEGRMTSPRDVQVEDFENLLFAKRFSIEQGVKSDGSIKIRAIDDETLSGVNSCTQGGDKIRCSGMDALIRAVHAYSYYDGGFKKLGLWKADIKSAYRRVPIRPDHRWLSWVALVVDGQTKVSRHNSCMFGAVGSVLAWDRIGEMIRVIAMKLLRIPSFRWVDDYFCAEPQGTLEHTKLCFARIVKAMLGEGAIAREKLEHGNPLTILGLDIKIGPKHITVWPTPGKVAQWTHELEKAEQSGVLHSGQASKMAGRLNFGAQHCFRKFGRVMIRPFYCQQYAPTRRSKCDRALRQAVRWWLEVFKKDLTQEISLKHRHKTTTMFCDASGSPPIVAAVLIDNKNIFFCESAVPSKVFEKFASRNDDQIMALELYAILMGIESFADKIASSNLTVWTDNVGGECALKRQTARAADHNQLVHQVWARAAALKAGIWINRVPSAENIADGPTRPLDDISMSILTHVNAIKCACRLPSEF